MLDDGVVGWLDSRCLQQEGLEVTCRVALQQQQQFSSRERRRSGRGRATEGNPRMQRSGGAVGRHWQPKPCEVKLSESSEASCETG